MGGIILVPPCLPLTSVLMDHFYPMENDSYKFPFFFADYVFLDQEEIYWISWLHMWLYYVLDILMNTGFVCIYILYVNEICGLSDILRFCEMLEDNFNIIFLSVVMNSVLPISLLYYYVAYSSAPVLKRVGGAGIWMGLNAFLCLFHWIGQAIIDHSNRTFNSAYSSDWTGMSVKDRKILLLIMMRCSKPYVLTTGKILPLSMESFGKAKNDKAITRHQDEPERSDEGTRQSIESGTPKLRKYSTPAQDTLRKNISYLQSQLSAAIARRDSGFGEADIEKKIVQFQKDIEKNKQKLASKMSKAKRHKKYHEQKMEVMKRVVTQRPDLVKKIPVSKSIDRAN
ncbi:hypothetical protein QAD02_018173 [Eretmocerus hayati]|uniref:Uncharacterized protein n=1 Tax=Eretmocerus hayati TaxID=131215 RepID=A0ACC2PH86_9HYME|nr:hypothetical protein QAD02_018173 [Eretmocerus hayati]